MSVHELVTNLLSQDIPGGRSNLNTSNKELRNLSEYCHKETFGKAAGKPPLEMTKVYAAQSLASVAYQINTLAANLVELLNLQHQQWGEIDHQINDISQQVNFYQEKRSRHLIGKLTSEKPVHLMKRVNAPAEKEQSQKYERHPINFTVWDHIGHGSPTRDSTPAAESPVKKPPGPGYRSSAIIDRKTLFTQQTTIDQDIYGTSFDVARYAKKPVAHSIPIAHSIPRTDNNTESELTATNELFVQGHTADSLYDTLSNTADGPPKSHSSSIEGQEPDATLFLPSPQREMRSPLASPLHPSSEVDLPPPPPAESTDFGQSTEDLDDDLYSPEEQDLPPPVEMHAPVSVSVPVPVSVPIPVSVPVPVPVSASVPEVAKPARPNNPAPPPPAAAPPSPGGQKVSGSRPSRSAPAPPPGGAKLSTSSSLPPRPPPPGSANIPASPSPVSPSIPASPLPVNPNIPSPPPDLPKPIQADTRIPAPPPNIPKDGLAKPKTGPAGSTGGTPSSPTKAPRPAVKGFDPMDIVKMQQSLKKRGAGPARSSEGDITPKTSASEKTPTEPRSFLKDTKSTPPPKTAPLPPSAPPATQGATADATPGSVPNPPPDIPEGWSKRPLGATKSEPVVKKTAVPKSQPSLPGFNPSQIIQHKLRAPKQTPSASSEGEAESSSTSTIPPKYIEIVETLFPYKAQKEDELNFSKGRTIYVLKKNPDEWYEGVLDGVRGLFPANYVKAKPAD